MEEELRALRENAQLVADMVGASSMAFVPGEYSEVPEGTKAIHFKFGQLEGRMIATKRSIEEERAILVREIDAQAEVVDAQLDLLDPSGASFVNKSRHWFRRGKKKSADTANPTQTILCADRILKRIELLKALKDLG